jgi:hypothetical protein
VNRALAIAILAIAFGACRSGPVDPGRERSIAALEGSASGSGETATLEGAPAPDITTGAQTCTADDECRVYQPSDWNPRVECCYEYGCDLDYAAVNTETWQQLRAWQRANPFDCTTHLREGGPCTSRTVECGLSQQAPAARCDDGHCAVVYPDPWPAIDPGTQRCTSDAECVAHRPSATSPEARCCGSRCESDWVAIARETAAELERWRADHAPACDVWRQSNPCPPPTACELTPPPVACRGGACVLASLPSPTPDVRSAP